jgi:YidC/Oxa1 family membrane protein insertase
VIASTNPFEILAPPLASLLAFFYGLVPNYGVAIILMTLAVMLVLAPLTWKGTRSMLAMQRLQPEIKRLQQQHKNDKAALNEAMMAFYKEHQINPLGGCLPLLLQMPVFFGLFRAVSGLTHKVKGQVQPKFISHNTILYKHLVRDHGTMKAFGIDLAKAASAHHSSFWSALPYLGLVAGIVFTGWYQQRQLTSRNSQAANANPQAQMMQKIFPVFFGLITYRFPAGVALYWLAQSVARIIQQWAMYRWDPSLTAEVVADIKEVEAKTAELDHPGSAKAALVAEEPRKGWLARLMEAASTQREAKGPTGSKASTAKGAKPKPGSTKPAGKAGAAKPPTGKPGGRPAAAKPPLRKPPADKVEPPADKVEPDKRAPDKVAPATDKPATDKPATDKPATGQDGQNGAKGNGQQPRTPRPPGNRPAPRKRRGR